MSWADRTVRGSDDRLRNLRVLHRELGLILEELTTMDEAERLAAHTHHEHLHVLVDRMAEEAGPTGEDPQRTQERIARAVRDTVTRKGATS